MKILFGLLFINLSFFINAQGNLQFNRIVNYTLNADIPTATIPMTR